jgi:prepilin-type N-terminal cleavage/methylation domain-containing protein
VSGFANGRRKKTGSPGFTLVEMVVALVVAGLILVGSAALMRYMVVATGQQSDQVLARLQVQYVGFWISQDVVQAQHMEIENSSGNATLMKKGFPLTITWEGDDGNNNTVVYNLQDSGQKPWELTRELKVNGVSKGISVVSQYLVPWSAQGLTDQGTWCVVNNEGNETNPRYTVLLTAAAQVDLAEASGTYNISPRPKDGNITLLKSG